jgi:hypothetical protein
MSGFFELVTYTFDNESIHGAEIVEALTAATRDEDLANAFATTLH